MDEAERLCDRVAIVDHGRVIALGTPRELISSLGAGHVIEFGVDGSREIDEAALLALRGRQVSTPRRRELGAAGRRRSRNDPHVACRRSSARDALTELRTHSPTLEDVFVTLTGRSLRDDA
jgi:ABC-2 type transport system ATP-binding protein